MSISGEQSQFGVLPIDHPLDGGKQPKQTARTRSCGSRDEGESHDHDASTIERTASTEDVTTTKLSSNTSCAVSTVPDQADRSSRTTGKLPGAVEHLDTGHHQDLDVRPTSIGARDAVGPVEKLPSLETSQLEWQLQMTETVSARIPSNEQIRAFAKSSHTLQDLRDSVLQCRTLLRFEESKEEQNERFTRESLDELTVAMREASFSGNWAIQQESIAKLSDRWLADADAYNAQRCATKEVRDRLSNLEFNLKTCEENFTAIVQGIGSALGISDEAVGLVSHHASLASDSASDTPPLVAELYDRKGDVGIYSERLMELEYQYHEDKVQRSFLADQEQPIWETDEAFESEYIRRKEEISYQLREAEADVKRLEEKCRKAGHRTELDVNVVSEESDVSASGAGEMTADDEQSLPQQNNAEQDLQRLDAWATSQGIAVGGKREPAVRKTTENLAIDKWLEEVLAEPYLHAENPIDQAANSIKPD